MNVLDFRRDARLLGRDPSSRRIADAFLAAVYGLALDSEQVLVFRQCTGRQYPRPGGYPEAVLITGRQSGKSETASDVVVFEAATAAKSRRNDGSYALLVAQDQRGAQRALFRYCSQAFEHSPLLAPSVANQTAETIALTNGVTIGVYPCRPAAIRGIRARVAVVDELAFFTATDNRPTDVEMLRAIRPALATTGGKLIILSSPYGQAGALWELHRQHYGREDSTTLVWQASAATMNPTLPADYLERMRQDDPDAYRSEVLGEFRAGVATFIDPETLDGCIADWRERLPGASHRYVGFADPASGSGKDSFTAAVAHQEGERTIVDAVKAWRPPFNPSGATAEAAEFFRSYGVTWIEGDGYAGEYAREGFKAAGVDYRVCELDRSRLYLELLPCLNAAAVAIPNDPALLRELRGLERRRGTSGRDRVDHRPGQHDDRANALAGAVYVCRQQRTMRLDVPTDRDPFAVGVRSSPWGSFEAEGDDDEEGTRTSWLDAMGR